MADWVLFGTAAALLLYALLTAAFKGGTYGMLPFAVPALLGVVGAGAQVLPEAAGFKLSSGQFAVLNGIGRVAMWTSVAVLVIIVVAEIVSRQKREPRRKRRWGALWGSLATIVAWLAQGGLSGVSDTGTTNLTLTGGAAAALIACMVALRRLEPKPAKVRAARAKR